MMTGDSEDRVEEPFRDVLHGLERLARDLDGRKSPIRSRPGATWGAPRRRFWRAVLTLGAAAAAVVVAILVQHDTARPRAGESGPAPAALIAATSAPASAGGPEGSPMPLVVIVEDLDSYSVIDLTSGVPLVSFALKSSCVPGPVVPVLPGPPGPTTGEGT
ncbi:MAG: hypothetical protein WBF17_10140 [Phycisphaerae bacterium]